MLSAYMIPGEGPWTALAVACLSGHTECAELLLAAGAEDPAGRALQACCARGAEGLAARILATKVRGFHCSPIF